MPHAVGSRLDALSGLIHSRYRRSREAWEAAPELEYVEVITTFVSEKVPRVHHFR